MKKVLVLAGALALTLAVGRVFADEAKAESKAGKSMKCEVVDVACYTAKGAKGADHKGCAVKCISGGGELALLSGKKLYVPVDKDFHSAREKFVPKAGEMVEVSGKVISKGGVNYLQIQ